MARMKEYDRGYLQGQIDSAENELGMLYEILHEQIEEPTKDSAILIRIDDTEDFLRENGIDPAEHHAYSNNS
jgi:hypothetical protein